MIQTRSVKPIALALLVALLLAAQAGDAVDIDKMPVKQLRQLAKDQEKLIDELATERKNLVQQIAVAGGQPNASIATKLPIKQPEMLGQNPIVEVTILGTTELGVDQDPLNLQALRLLGETHAWRVVAMVKNIAPYDIDDITLQVMLDGKEDEIVADSRNMSYHIPVGFDLLKGKHDYWTFLIFSNDDKPISDRLSCEVSYASSTK